MSSKSSNQRSADSNSLPTLQDGAKGQATEVKGKIETARARKSGDLGEGVMGAVDQVTGRLDQAASTITADAIGEAERVSAATTLEGQRQHVRGAMHEAAGKNEAALGRTFHKPEQEAKGLEKEEAGRIEKELGRAEEEDGRKAFKEAFHADAEYMKIKR